MNEDAGENHTATSVQAIPVFAEDPEICRRVRTSHVLKVEVEREFTDHMMAAFESIIVSIVQLPCCLRIMVLLVGCRVVGAAAPAIVPPSSRCSDGNEHLLLRRLGTACSMGGGRRAGRQAGRQ